MFFREVEMSDKVWVLTFHYYMGIDGSGSYILGIYTTEQLAKEAKTHYLQTRDADLATEEYNSEWLELKPYLINSPATDYF